jgi:hypothetical protein
LGKEEGRGNSSIIEIDKTRNQESGEGEVVEIPEPNPHSIQQAGSQRAILMGTEDRNDPHPQKNKASDPDGGKKDMEINREKIKGHARENIYCIKPFLSFKRFYGILTVENFPIGS